MPPRRHRTPKPDRRRALELLASCRDGCTEAILLPITEAGLQALLHR